MGWHAWTLLIAGSFYLCIALLSVLYWSMRREAVRVLSFGALCIGLALVAGATLVSSSAWIDGALLRQVSNVVHVGLGIALAGYISFLGALVPLPRIVVASGMAVPVWIFLALPFGLLEPTLAAPRWTLAHVGPQLLPLAWWGVFHTAVGLGSVVVANVFLVQTARRAKKPVGRDTPLVGSPNLSRLETFGILAAGALTVGLAFHDALCVLGLLRSPLTIATVSILPVGATAFSFVLRVVETSKALRARLAELQEAQNALRTVRRRLSNQEQLAMVGELSAVIAHQVRNALGVIKNVVAGLGRTNLAAADRTTLFEILDEELEKLSQLMENLMAYARPVDPIPRSLNARTFLEEVLARRKWSGDVELHWFVAEDSRICADPALLQQAIDHILDNANLAMPNGGTLAIRCEHDAPTSGSTPSMRLSFEDSGGGMTKEQVEKAKSPFFTTRANGSGLGLAIATRVLRSHQGRLEIESSKQGTSVRCHLPTRQDLSVDGQEEQP